MSMLAERKVKQKWILQPRGNDWSKDSKKFGQRILEKMGWSQGKGLGANEDGIKEHIKVKYKNNSDGLGYESKDDQWTQHETNFSELLANLGSGAEAKNLKSVKIDTSLEKLSKKSRARVHYHKFTRGKDLATRSEKDIASIFGRKTLEKEETVEKTNEITVNSYFTPFLNKVSNASITTKKENYDSDSEITNVGFGYFSNDSTIEIKNGDTVSSKVNQYSKTNFINFVSSTPKVQIEENNINNIPKKKKKKDKKIVGIDNKGSDINILEEVCYENPCLNAEDNPEVIGTENGLDNPAFNPKDDEKKQIKSVTFASPLAEYSLITNYLAENTKKRKKKKKRNEGIDNPACEEFPLEKEVITTKSKKKKRKYFEEENVSPSKKLKYENGIQNLACDDYSIEDIKSTITEPITTKIKKKKRKSSSVDNCADNLGCSINIIEEEIESITNEIDKYQNEVENEINQQKDKKSKKEYLAAF